MLIYRQFFFNVTIFFFLQFPCSVFYKKTSCKTIIIPADPNVSEDESFDDDDNDPDYVPEPHNTDTPSTSNEPPAKRVCARPTFDEEEELSEDEDDHMEIEEKVV